ncbi:MAG: hypothetical protein IT200_16370 [Thermoleophilia bacterium]|nr:hypothetical protein [Thermoleophilia bacterium]
MLAPFLILAASGTAVTWLTASKAVPTAVPAGWSIPEIVPRPPGGTYVTSPRPNGRTRLTAHARTGARLWFAERGPGGIERIEGVTPGPDHDDTVWSIDW